MPSGKKERTGERTGKLIAIEGIDGSGKTVQSKKLFNYLAGLGFDARYIEFPDYGSEYGKLIAKFLRGEFGSLNGVNPKLLGILYAADRLAAKQAIDSWIANGCVIVANRYAESNIAHQGVRIQDSHQRKELQDWLRKLDYEIFGIHKADVVIVLDILPTIAQSLLSAKDSRDYLHGKKKDIHESSKSYQALVRQAYLECAGSYGWNVVECFKGNELLSVELVHDKITRIVSNVLK